MNDLVSAEFILRQRRLVNYYLRALLAEMQALFAGGALREEDKKYVLDALTEAYLRTKQQGKENSHG